MPGSKAVHFAKAFTEHFAAFRFDNRGATAQSADMEPSNSAIAVTGAGGFIGHALCRRLVADKLPVRAMVQYRSELPGEYQFDLVNHILDPALLNPPPRAVVHCAWDTRVRSLREARRVNVEGTQWLADQCRKAGVQQFVFVSSLAAHAGSKSVYGRTKWGTEQTLLSLPDASTFSTIIAPGLVVGNGGAFAKARLIVKRRWLVPLFPGFGGRRLPTVYIDDLCSAIVSSINHKVTGRLSIANEKGVSLADFYQGLGILERRKPMLFPLPDAAMLPARLLEIMRRRPPGLMENLRGLQQWNPSELMESAGKLGCEPMTDYWKSLERLANQEGATDAASRFT